MGMSEAKHEIAREVGSRIRRYRQAAGFSQERLAREVDVSYTTINRAESGFHLASIDTLARIADALDVRLKEDLLGMRPSGASDQMSYLGSPSGGEPRREKVA